MRRIALLAFIPWGTQVPTLLRASSFRYFAVVDLFHRLRLLHCILCRTGYAHSNLDHGY